MTRSRLIIIVLTASVTSLIVSGINLAWTLRPDQKWCAEHHLICYWGGRMEFDPAYWSEEAQLKRIEEQIAKSAKITTFKR